ncbi:MTREC (exosome adaptor) complex subunit Red1 [Schizosaccharomyces pombe]|uniref:NURS complex subunit red1 n=1 Tax=Schizosaccharomyces pombe (strain 972 / ATCC 24843) TaxID=284812 RepID=RED1_SCHPO|nr:RNA elimination defective protein red1 [Schizosaccharomyces pombe]Q9UTR8.2 RecName: Full=NURS complex subunit red1 [Schizosaccharomyces pombe 972h-]CAB60233.2 RNA elimination defective protein Red1 [Schizosaccharomyces pombe]|eukprot:NP_594850.2 RNA elimination defective protein red1 [Schizosaccharomyces pombe]
MSRSINLDELRKKALESKKKNEEDESNDSDKEDGEISEDDPVIDQSNSVPPMKVPTFPEQIPQLPPFDRFPGTNANFFPFGAPFMLPPALMFGPNTVPFFPQTASSNKTFSKRKRSSENSFNNRNKAKSSETSDSSNTSQSFKENRALKDTATSRPLALSSDTSYQKSEKAKSEKSPFLSTSKNSDANYSKTTNQKEAEKAVSQLFEVGVRFNDFIAEGIEPSVVHTLFLKLGLDSSSASSQGSLTLSADKAARSAKLRKIDSNLSDTHILPGDNGTPTVLPERKNLISLPLLKQDDWLSSSKPFGSSTPNVVIEFDSDDDGDDFSNSKIEQSNLEKPPSNSENGLTMSRSDYLALLRNKEEEIRRMTKLILRLESNKKPYRSPTSAADMKLPSVPVAAVDNKSKTHLDTFEKVVDLSSKADFVEAGPSISSSGASSSAATTNSDTTEQILEAPWLRKTEQIAVVHEEHPAQIKKSEIDILNNLIEKEEGELTKYQTLVKSKTEILTQLYTRKKQLLEQQGKGNVACLPKESDLSMDSITEVSAQADENSSQILSSKTSNAPNGTTETDFEDKVPLVDYISPFYRFKSYRFNQQFVERVPLKYRSLTYSNKIEPMKVFCKYETTGGVCNDDHCEASHFRDIKMTDDEIIQDLSRYIEGNDEIEKESYKSGLDIVMKNTDENTDFVDVATRIVEYHNLWKSERMTIPVAKVSI